MSRVENVRSCARCGGDHDGVVFAPLANAVVIGGVRLTHWAACPASGEPILMEIIYRVTTFEEKNPPQAAA